MSEPGLGLPAPHVLVRDGVRYEIGAEFARGAFGTVHRACDDRGHRLVAKVFHAEAAPGAWRAEAAMLERLRHPGVVRLHAGFEHEGRGHLLLADGGTSVDRFRPETALQRLALARVVAHDLLQALHFIHASGCVHADVKPGNVLVDLQARPARARLCDMGLAFRVAEPPERLRLADWNPPPERLVEGGPARVGPHIDVYGAAMLLLEILHGPQAGFADPDAIRDGRPRRFAADQGTPLGAALAEGLQPDPASRPSARALWRLLRPALNDAAVRSGAGPGGSGPD